MFSLRRAAMGPWPHAFSLSPTVCHLWRPPVATPQLEASGADNDKLVVDETLGAGTRDLPSRVQSAVSVLGKKTSIWLKIRR